MNKNKLTILLIILGSFTGIFVSMLLGFEYGAYGVIMIMLLSIKNIPILLSSQLIWNVISIYLFSFSIYQILAFLGILLCVIIKRKNNSNIYKLIPKNLNYLIYPIHLLILLLIKINWR